MDFELVMDLLSKNNVGAILLDEDDIVTDFNEIARLLLVSTGILPGYPLPESLQELKTPDPQLPGLCVGFRNYIMPVSNDEGSGIPEGQHLITFRDVSDIYEHHMMKDALQHIHEAVIFFDAKDRVFFLNNALQELDSLVPDEVLGKSVDEVYAMTGDKDYEITKARLSKKPHLNHRQSYSTKYGKELSTLSSTYPVLENSTVVGTYNILENWSTTNELQKQIIDLQEKLLHHPTFDGKKEKSSLTANYHFEDITYNCHAMKQTLDFCRRAAETDASVLIYGETGTGKELFAQGIHNASRRADRPFIAVNCAALPANILDSLLFGSVKGAFTGAENRAGLFEQASGGTLLLDEINSMDISLQAKLLRVLQEKRMRRVGGEKEIAVDVRVISNINIPPSVAIKEHVLREDLYYRLGEVNIQIPPLRKRGNDIFLLARSFIDEYNKRLLKNISDLSPTVKTIFLSYNWPGNVRELQHAILHAMSIMPDGVTMIGKEYLPSHFLESGRGTNQGSRNASVSTSGSGSSSSGAGAGYLASGQRRMTPPAEELPADRTSFYRRDPDPDDDLAGTSLPMSEKDLVLRALEMHGGNVAAAARDLSLSRQSLQYRIKKYGVNVEKIKLRQRMKNFRG
ncbi:MAG: sigma 54-interacting transcriptional regulator [Eubacterium sp.]|nr:sigma 54-interacting transcriptional regulator [Eubacterium sp.]